MVKRTDSPPAQVVVLGTGGTIAGRAAAAGDNIGYTAAQLGVDDLLRGIDLPAGVTARSEQVAQLDSKDMDFAVWQTLAVRCAEWLAHDEVTGIVITHGTDTLEETAFFLQSVLSPAKPVVLTGAMRPASALAPDGPQNLRDAITVVVAPGARGVAVVCAGAVHSAFDVQKVHAYRLDAFDSGDAGPLAHVEEGELRQLRAWPEASAAASAVFGRIVQSDPARWPRVEILTSHAGASGRLVDALLQERSAGAEDPVQGLVLAATGNGTLHRLLEAAALRAQEEGVAVLRATRCVQGRILATPHATLPHAGGLTPVKARIALMLELMGDGGLPPSPA
jgi:L-asparaginase